MKPLIHDNVFYNNVSAFNTSYQIDLTPLGSNNVFDYNNWYGTKPNHPSDGANTLHVDPGFGNQQNMNYHLALTSPLLDRGIDLLGEGVTNDLDGRARPDGSGFDIGAFEYIHFGPDATSVLLPLIIWR
jgi:hypothetical protein